MSTDVRPFVFSFRFKSIDHPPGLVLRRDGKDFYSVELAWNPTQRNLSATLVDIESGVIIALKNDGMGNNEDLLGMLREELPSYVTEETAYVKYFENEVVAFLKAADA